MKGRDRTPDNVHQLRGTHRGDRHGAQGGDAYSRVEEVPPCPGWMPNAHACVEWERLAPLLIDAGMLTEAGLSTFAVFCALHGQIMQQFSAGLTPDSKTLSQYRLLSTDFGFTPASLTKMGKASGGRKPKGNRFSSNGRRPE